MITQGADTEEEVSEIAGIAELMWQDGRIIPYNNRR
jgi:hypothetical protein